MAELTQEELALNELLGDESTPGSIDSTIKVFPDETKLDKNKTTGRSHRALLKSVITRIKAWVKAELLGKSDTGHTHTIADVADLQTNLANKVDKVAGKQLSTEDYTTAEKQKLAGLESSHFKGLYGSLAALQAAVPVGIAGDYAHVDTGAGADAKVYIWDVSDAAWLMQAGDVAGETAASIKTKYESNPDTNAFTDAEKTKLASLNDVTVDTALSATSTNPLQNKVVTEELGKKADANSLVYPIGLTQNRTFAPVPLTRGKATAVASMVFDTPITGVTYQLYKAGVSQPVRTSLAQINADLAAMTAAEKNSGGFIILNFSGSAGWEVGSATLTLTIS